MTAQPFEAALAECLAALDRGEHIDFLLLRYPAHEAELRRAIALRKGLARSVIAVPESMRARGEQRLRVALTEPRARRLGVLPRAAVQALLGLAIVSGAVGASAAAGGPNLPGQVLQAVGLIAASDDAPDATSSRATARVTAPSREVSAPEPTTATVTATPSSVAAPSPTATGQAESGARGLCQSYLAGGLGQNGQANPEAFARLVRAAGATDLTPEARAAAIAAYCATPPASPASSGGVGAAATAPTSSSPKPEPPVGAPTAEPTVVPTVTPTPDATRGPSDANGNGNGNSGPPHPTPAPKAATPAAKGRN